MKFTIIELNANGAGTDFWKHASYRLKIDDKYIGANISALEVLERIEDELKARAYRPPTN
jgi:hypothetical protein